MMDMPFSVKCCLLSRIVSNLFQIEVQPPCNVYMFSQDSLVVYFCKPEIDVINWKLEN